MNHRKIQMPREVYIGPDIIFETADIFESLHLNRKVLLISGHHTYDAGAKYAIESLEEKDFDVDVIIVNDASFESVHEVEEKITPIILLLVSEEEKLSMLQNMLHSIRMYILFQCQLLLHTMVLYLL